MPPIKERTAQIKLQVPGGQANPAPPVGPALGQRGVNIGEFVKRFNDATKDQMGVLIPVLINVYADRSFDFVLKSPTASFLLKRAAGLAKGAVMPGREQVAQVTREQIREIAHTKKLDLGSHSPEAALRIIEGTARSMGIDVVE